METLRAQGKLPTLPPLKAGGHLVNMLMQAGPVMPGAMGATPLTSLELNEWQKAQAVRLSPWEHATLRRMSAAWAAESQRATRPACPPPWFTAGPNNKRAVAKRIKALFRG